MIPTSLQRPPCHCGLRVTGSFRWRPVTTSLARSYRGAVHSAAWSGSGAFPAPIFQRQWTGQAAMLRRFRARKPLSSQAWMRGYKPQQANVGAPHGRASEARTGCRTNFKTSCDFKLLQHKPLAEGEGFEPPEGSHPQRFSRPPQSTALPPLRLFGGIRAM